MKDFFLKYLASTRLMSVLFFVFPAAMGLGTFIESWYSTDTAKIWIYNAWWFELIMALFVLNFIGNIFRYRLLRKEKWAVLAIHLSFILILVGAFVTRYIGYEGVMPIREGDSTNAFLSEKTYLTVLIDGDFEQQALRKKLQKQLLLSQHVDNDFTITDDFKGEEITIEYVDFMENATEGLVLDPEGERYLKIVEASDGNRHDHYIKEGDVANIHNLLFTLDNPIKGAINIEVKDGEYFISSPFAGSFMRMADQFQGELTTDRQQLLQLRSLYSLPNFQFVIPEPVLRGKFDIVEAEEQPNARQDALRLQISAKGQTKTVSLLGGKGYSNDPKKVQLGGFDFYLTYGSLRLELPFQIGLNDFVAEKYPGTEKSYASFESKVTVKNIEESFDYDIYMNHVLDHQGYRFFQSSFDPDEKGTVLSVNHDWWGTYITYAGYMLLYLSMMAIFFMGKTRFKDLAKAIDKIKAKKAALTLFFLLGLNGLNAQDHLNHSRSKINFDSLVIADAFPADQAEKFGALVIQDLGEE